MKILVIDDDPLSLSGIQMVIKHRCGCECIALSDPVAAMKLYREEHFDAVISDVRMPGMSGIDVLRTVKQINPQAAVILITGFRTPELTEALAAHGAHAFFYKPLRADKLLETLRSLDPAAKP